MNILNRADLPEDYQEMMVTESHHDHEIIKDEHGTIRWKRNEPLNDLVDNTMNLNHIVMMFRMLGHGKNSEIYRELYRNMGVSLSMYWEVFYWEANNPEAHKYTPPLNGLKVVRDFCTTQHGIMSSSITPDKGEHFRASMKFAMVRMQHVINITNALLGNETTV